MGAWGVGVLQGDTPLDILYCIGEMLDESNLYPMEFSPRRSAMLVQKLEKRQHEIAVALTNDQFRNSYTRNGDRDTLPVLAALVMAVGAPMSDALRETAIKAAEENAENAEVDGWVDPVERATAMTGFANLIRAYQTGQRVPIQQMNKGLFETIAGG